MTIDVSVLVIALALTFLGYRAGLLSQGVRIAALLGVVFASPFVAAVLRTALFGESQVTVPLIEGICLFMAGIVLYVGISLSGWLAIKTMRAASDALTTTDRFGGALVGLLKALVIVYLLVFIALFFESALAKHDPDDRLRMRDGHATQFVRENNVLAPWHLPDLVHLHSMIRVAQLAEENQNLKALRDHGKAADVLRLKEVSELVKDQTLRDAAQKRDFLILLQEQRVRDLLKNTDVMDDIRAVSWDEIETSLTLPDPRQT